MKRRTRRKVKKVKILGEVVSKGGSRYKFLLGERRHFLKRQRDPESSYYVVPISELLKSNRRRGLRRNKGNLPRTQFDYANSQIMMALKTLKKRNYNDEMIETISIKKRPGHPRDFIIIVKHRYFVNGARVYSAGLKTEDTIENFVPIIGKKTKRVGKSDYVFNVYGVRYPRDVKQKLGKLFGNPKSFPNIEKSGFNRGQYVGYSPKAVNFFSITRDYRGWKAIGQIYKTNPPGTAWKIIYGKDLAEISKALENL